MNTKRHRFDRFAECEDCELTAQEAYALGAHRCDPEKSAIGKTMGLSVEKFMAQSILARRRR